MQKKIRSFFSLSWFPTISYFILVFYKSAPFSNMIHGDWIFLSNYLNSRITVKDKGLSCVEIIYGDLAKWYLLYKNTMSKILYGKHVR